MRFELDYSERGVHGFNLTLSLFDLTVSRAVTYISFVYRSLPEDEASHMSRSQIRVQWMTITSFVPCYALHAPLHVAI